MQGKRLQRQPDFDQFLKVLRREGKPQYLPFYEHLASGGFIAGRTETKFDQMSVSDPGYWNIYVDFWLGMGYDCIPMEIPLNCPLPHASWAGEAPRGSEANKVIAGWEDFENSRRSLRYTRDLGPDSWALGPVQKFIKDVQKKRHQKISQEVNMLEK